MIYTTDHCVWCQRAEQLLTARGLQYRELNLARDEPARAALAARTGRMTFPQILIDCEPIGGYEDLARALARTRGSEAHHERRWHGGGH